jgi:soluble lytic murein transglycosylase
MSRTSRGEGASVAALKRGRLRLMLVTAAVVAVAAGLALTARVRPEHSLPLRDESIIRVQAQEKHIDPALIAAIIYAETKFVPRESAAGAQGLMQILPSTALYLAKLSDGTTFTTKDLADPKVNIAYGSYYLRYLLGHYGGQQLPAIAAYNAGLSNVDAWTAKARAQGRPLGMQDILFPETRTYVARVLSAESAYRRFYGRRLGLE